MPKTSFSTLILAWFDDHKRDLPWRRDRNPYSIWLSEIILQQTRVAQGQPYYERFIARYPSVMDLAAAPEPEVLRLWQGLGYYSRARNLHKCAKTIADDFDGEFPQTMAGLEKLPGIGKYTAAAIASQAFEEPVPVVDGNVYRLLARYFGLETDITTAAAYRAFYQVASEQLDRSRPGDFNQAMMEFGAIQCSPKRPACASCPLTEGCYAHKHNLQGALPVKRKKTKVRQRYFHYFLIRCGNDLLLGQRQGKDIWQGLYEFPLHETPQAELFEEISHPLLDQIPRERAIYTLEDKIHRHVLSHQVLNVNFVVIDVDDKVKNNLVTDGYRWFSFATAEGLPKPVLVANYLDSYLNSIHLQEEIKSNGRS